MTLTGRPPQVQYPDGEIRDYPAGLEPARERLNRDNASLRETGFNVRKFIPTIADFPTEEPFRALLASMREHGFMKQFSIVRYEDGTVVDGLAREKAAIMLQLDVEYLKYSDKDRKAAQRRDTPLDRILVAIDSNTNRLSKDVIDVVYRSVADVTHRAWGQTAADLALTQEWRRSMTPEYSPRFEVELLAYHEGDGPKVQVTADRKVMMRSLMQAAVLAAYKTGTELSSYVPFEKARSPYSGGPKAVFARAEDLIAGIETMLQERRAAKRKIDPGWDEILSWLVRNFGSTRS